MNNVEILLLGFGLGSIPSSELARIGVATLAKRLGVKPGEIEKYNNATENNE